MSHQIKGVVDRTTTKTVTTKYGDKPTFTYTVDGVDFSSGFKREHQDGEMVSVEVEWKYNQWQKMPGFNGEGKPAATAGGGTGGTTVTQGNFAPKGGGTFPIDIKSGQISIIRQSSMNRAVEIMGQLMEHMYTDDNGNTTITEDEYMKKLFEIAMTITDFGSGQDIMNLQAAMLANRKVS